MKQKKNPRNPGSGNPSIQKHRGWSDTEKKVLKKLKAGGLDNIAIAKKMRRTLYSILSEITILKIANKKHSASVRKARLAAGKKKGGKQSKPRKVPARRVSKSKFKPIMPKIAKSERVDLTSLPPATSGV